MSSKSATAIAHPNIAFIKYWGNRDPELRLPSNSSLSLTLAGLTTQTAVTFDPALSDDVFEMNGVRIFGQGLRRVSAQLNLIRQLADDQQRASVVSENSFPHDVGIASSASGMAALTVAASAAAGLELDTHTLSRLARRASGSAARSVLGGYVEWLAGASDESSFARQFLPSEHWELVDWIAVVADQPKRIGSTMGHQLANTSPLHEARVSSVPDLLARCKHALLDRDFERLAAVIELDSNAMHAVMLTSSPPLMYWAPASIDIMHNVSEWRSDGLQVAYTLDAGPTVHCICTLQHSAEVESKLRSLPNVQRLLRGQPGPAAHLIASP